MNYESTIDSSESLDGDDARKRRRWLIIAAVALAIIVGALAISYFFSAGDETAKTSETAKAGGDAENQAQSLTVVVPGSDTVKRIINASGSLAARREIMVGVVGEGGRVTAVYADAGDWVKKGQTLVAIDRSVQNQQAESLRAQIGVARADLRLAENELSRALKLVDRGFISKADVDRKTATRDAAHARLHVAQAQFNQAKASNARLTVVAPVGGYVLERNVEQGQTATAGGGPIFRIAKGGEIELQAQLGEGDLAAIPQGTPASVTPVDAERSFQGQVWQISPTINPQTRQGVARIALPFDRALKPGGFASVTFEAGAVTAPILPESAIQTDKAGKSFVFIVDKDNKAKRRNVKLGKTTAKGIPVFDGLGGTERVVLYAGAFLSEGEVVNPKPLKSEK